MKSNSLDVLFVIVDVNFMLENAPVLQAQVGDHAVALAKNGFRVGILGTSRDGSRFRKVLGDRLSQADVGVWLVSHGNRISNILRMIGELRRISAEIGFANTYVRGIWGALAVMIAFPFGGPRNIYDV